MCTSLKTFFCCMSLEVGTQIISFLNLLAPIAETAYCLYVAFTLPLTEIKVTSIYVVLAVLGIFEFFCATVFLYGTFKKQPSFLWPWLALAWLKAAVLLVLFVVWVTLMSITSYTHYSEIILVVVFIVYALILIYFGCVSNSRRRELQSETYSQYAPRRTRSNSAIVKNVYVPITKPLNNPEY
ncbi:hypothetical protein NE865_09169 [Phthorimaea operculella]|nr:hypothetical protein NE865_09169 [Phthorimaea operculella]